MINVISGLVRKYAAVPVQLEIVILQYIDWCVLIVRAIFFNQRRYFCQFLMDYYYYYYKPQLLFQVHIF
jgi:hypothetical protein